MSAAIDRRCDVKGCGKDATEWVRERDKPGIGVPLCGTHAFALTLGDFYEREEPIRTPPAADRDAAKVCECGHEQGWHGDCTGPCRRNDCNCRSYRKPSAANRQEWERQYDEAMRWRDWQTCEILIAEREQAAWYMPDEDHGPRIDTSPEVGSLPDTKEGRYEGRERPAAHVSDSVYDFDSPPTCGIDHEHDSSCFKRRSPDAARGCQLSTLGLHELDEACRPFVQAFGEHPYLVGSANTRPDFRDVDVRLILPDDEYDALFAARPGLWSLLSRLGTTFLRTRTGLPVDFQVQRQTEANAKYGDLGKTPRNPLGTRNLLDYAGGGDATP